MNDLKFSIRQLVKNPGFTAVAVFSLALGIGLNAAVFSIINTVFFQTIRGVDQPHRVVLGSERISYPGYLALKSDADTLSGVAARVGTSVVYSSEGNQTGRRRVPAVSGNYFSTLGVQPVLGQFFEDTADAPPSALPEVVLDFQFWERHWESDPTAIGKSVNLNGIPFTVVGIAPEAFHGPGPERPPFWVRLGMLPQLEGAPIAWVDPQNRRVRVIGRLASGATVDQLQSETAVVFNRQPELSPGKPLLFGAGREKWVGDESLEKRAEFLLVTIVPLVVTTTILWIACSNVANLLLARGVGRRREIAIRLATGASRWRVLRVLLLESLLLALLGGALGLMVSQWTVQFVFATFSNFSSLAVSIDGLVLAYTAGISILSTLFFGLVPALQATQMDVSSNLKSDGAGTGRDWRGARLRDFFLVTQIGCSMALLVITATFVRSLVADRYGDIGRQIDHLLVAQLPELSASTSAPELQRELRAQLMALPGVRFVTLMEAEREETSRLHLPGMEGQTNVPSVTVSTVDAGYFQTFGIEFLSGRNLDPTSTFSLTREVVINEVAASRFWSGQEPIGQQFSLDEMSGLAVSGVVRDDSEFPQFYRPLVDSASVDSAMIQTSIEAGQLVDPVRQVLQQLGTARSLPEVATLHEVRTGGMAQMTRVSGLVGGLALLLASVGLFGSMAFTSRQRTREMGIRLALGASRGRVARIIVRDGLEIVAIGCTVGLILVLAAFQLLTGLIFGKWTLDLVSLGIVASVFGLVAFAACWLPARRASRIDPMTTLRNE